MFKTLSSMWLPHYRIICLALTAALGMTGCNKDISDADKGHTVKLLASYNTSQFLLNKLKDNRILFIGDFGHRRYLYKKTVTDFLMHWIDQIEAGTDSVPRKVFLVLETDSIEVSLIKSSLEDFDAGAWLGKSRPGSLAMTTGGLQFCYHDIGNIYKRIVSYNAGSSADSICFDIVGPERIIDLENWSVVKRDSFFVYERDQYMSARIIELLDRHPEYKTVVFYGGAHLQRTKQLKHTETVEDSGYYLAHYVADRFDDDGGVYTVYQSAVSEGFMRDNGFMTAPGETYAIDNKLFERDWFAHTAKSPHWIEICDGSVMHFEPAVIDPPLGTIRSQRIVDYMLGQVEKYRNSQHDFFGKYWHIADRYLRIVSGIGPARMNTYTYEDWVNWSRSTPLDMVQDMTSLRLWERLIDGMEAAEGESAHAYDTLIARTLRVLVNSDTSKTPAEKARAYRQHLILYDDEIVTENLVNLLLVGTDEEIDKALPILRDLTGQNFDAASDWANWLRKSGIANHPF